MKLAKVNAIEYSHKSRSWEEGTAYVPVCNYCNEPVISGLQIGATHSGETYCDKPCAYEVRGKDLINDWLNWDEEDEDEAEEPDAWFTEHLGFYLEDEAEEILDLTDREVF